MAELWMWRHPRAEGAAGRCIGRTDLAVDRRKAKRLAHRVRAAARRHGLPREVWTSRLERAHAVGRCLAHWGWVHRVDDRLLELDFGRWDGLAWACIAREEVAAWEADFAGHAPGGGESLAGLIERVEAFLRERAGTATVAIGHAGWMQWARWRAERQGWPSAAQWPRAPRHGSLVRVGLP